MTSRVDEARRRGMAYIFTGHTGGRDRPPGKNQCDPGATSADTIGTSGKARTDQGRTRPVPPRMIAPRNAPFVFSPVGGATKRERRAVPSKASRVCICGVHINGPVYHKNKLPQRAQLCGRPVYAAPRIGHAMAGCGRDAYPAAAPTITEAPRQFVELVGASVWLERALHPAAAPICLSLTPGPR